MKIKLLALGEKMPKWVMAGFDEYSRRLSGSTIQLQLIELPIAKRTKTASIAKYLEQEAKTLLSRFDDNDHLVILDVQSKQISTEELAQRIQNWQQHTPNVAIVIGGPDGIDQCIKAQAQEKISLSRMTFPHPIVRIIFAEQIYRAWTILQGHPYHK
ncbi:23S rRNA (pseudouridine(1915)-N(3))-methyltransferase RlmH [Fastidiosibacter lacustris]|uniref:23S rRNA (pseudouridine(1915)-N(3))-methyltransferase RlmH n=1 Tax=Fastidiosibacter lacustris TaxID=2056695 RepID=UPI000E357E6E|nr:23S rRNA (pseudouridine(1915)-N(3))-methyltransferase RlmH [Fastidiosibacter lacustris]